MDTTPRPTAESGGNLKPAERNTPRRAREISRYALVRIAVDDVHASIEVEAFGAYCRPYPEGRDGGGPAETGGLIVDRVEYDGRDITALFTADQLAAMATEADE